jgi:hypothetical protein
MPKAFPERAASSVNAVAPLGSFKVPWLPFTASLVLAAYALFVSRISDNPHLAYTFWAVSGMLFAFLVLGKISVTSELLFRPLHKEVANTCLCS